MNNTGTILETIYKSGIEGMENKEKVIIISKLMKLVQRKEGRIEEFIWLLKALHDKCYRFASMRDCLHRLRARIFDLLTQLRDSEERVREMI